MADILQTGLEWLAAQNKTHRATLVTYKRGNYSASITATYGKKTIRIPQANGVYIHIETIDWLMLAADLIINSTLTEPQPGDRIEWTDANSDVHVYEVQPIGDENCFRYSDPGQTSLRIHTQQMDLQ